MKKIKKIILLLRYKKIFNIMVMRENAMKGTKQNEKNKNDPFIKDI